MRNIIGVRSVFFDELMMRAAIVQHAARPERNGQQSDRPNFLMRAVSI